MSSTSVTAYYGTMPGQDHRSSDDFPEWDAPENCTITFEVTVQDSSKGKKRPQPTFSIWHNINNGQDTQWYTGLKNGSQISPTYQNGDAGGYRLYVVTTDNDGEDSGATYTVKATFS